MSRIARYSRLLAFGIAMVAWDFAWQTYRIVKPDENLDYRGAYEYVLAHRCPDDALWAQTAVVYQTYYGKAATVYGDDDLPGVERLMGMQRVWAVFGSNRHDLRQRLEAAGGRVTQEHGVSGLTVLLLE